MKKLYSEYLNCLNHKVRCKTKDKKRIHYIILSSYNGITTNIVNIRQNKEVTTID